MLPPALAQLPHMKEKSIYKNSPKRMRKNTYAHMHSIMGKEAFMSQPVEEEASLQSRELSKSVRHLIKEARHQQASQKRWLAAPRGKSDKA